MSTNTPNYQLLKPDPSENVNVVSQLNDNYDTVDTELKRVDDLAVAAGVWTQYVLTWASSGTQPAIGNGTKNAAYCRTGKTCHVRGTILMGNTTTFGTGNYTFSLPFQAASPAGLGSTMGWSGVVNAIDAGTTYKVGAIGINTGASIFEIFSGDAGNLWAATVPFTWANADRLTFSLTYETV